MRNLCFTSASFSRLIRLILKSKQMIRNYFLIAIRNFIRHSSISFINIIGLSLGLACTMFIYLWVTNELSFDRFHENADRLYRVDENQHYTNGVYRVTVTPWPSGPVWKEKIPEIEKACRVAYAGTLLMRRGDKAFYESDVQGVDSTFFTMFSFPLLKGDPVRVLKDPQSIVLSEETARKYFGREDPIGKELKVDNKTVFTVTGVMKNMPANSSIRLSMVISFDYMKTSPWYSDNWGNNSIFTYLLLKRNADPLPVNKKLTEEAKTHNPDSQTDFVLEPYTRMHLYSYFGYDRKQWGIMMVYIFSTIALLVLIIACINFMNLSTARSATRAKEIGLRKVNGAHRNNLVSQFFVESLLMSFGAMVIAVLIVSLLITPFNTLSGKEFTESDLLTPFFILSAIAIATLTGLFAGIYPSLVLSSFGPIKTLKGGFSLGLKGGMFRKVTVIIQFTLSIILIAGTFVINRQLHYMQSQKLGYDKENLVYIWMQGDLKKQYPALKEELLKVPVVKAVTASSHPPHMIGSNSGGIDWPGKDPKMQTLVSMSGIDFDYVEAMGIEMKSGRAFSKAYPGDVPHDTIGSFLVNEALEKLMGKDNAVGTELRFAGMKGPVIGVMKDYHYQSMRYLIEPLAVFITPGDWWSFMFIRLVPGNTKDELRQVEKTWARVVPEYPFDYHFVDEEYDKMYRPETRIGTLINYFAVLAILIACIGLFGLATFTVEQKTREVGIRKALGAPVSAILYLFSKEFLQLLVIAAVISIPLSWYLLSRWLMTYDYRAKLNFWIFLGAALLALLVAMLAMSWQALRAVRTNPAETLKYE